MGNITVLANQISFEDFMSARKITEADIKAIIRDNIRDGLAWDFEWGSGVRRFGCCTTWRSRPGYVRITISRLLANNNDYETVRQVVLHEVAHANVGGGHGHDYVWQRERPEGSVLPIRAATTAVRVPQRPRHFPRSSSVLAPGVDIHAAGTGAQTAITSRAVRSQVPSFGQEILTLTR